MIEKESQWVSGWLRLCSLYVYDSAFGRCPQSGSYILLRYINFLFLNSYKKCRNLWEVFKKRENNRNFIWHSYEFHSYASHLCKIVNKLWDRHKSSAITDWSKRWLEGPTTWLFASGSGESLAFRYGIDWYRCQLQENTTYDRLVSLLSTDSEPCLRHWQTKQFLNTSLQCLCIAFRREHRICLSIVVTVIRISD